MLSEVLNRDFHTHPIHPLVAFEHLKGLFTNLFSIVHRIASFMRVLLSISLCLQYEAGRVVLGVRWGRHQQRRWSDGVPLIRSSAQRQPPAWETPKGLNQLWWGLELGVPVGLSVQNLFIAGKYQISTGSTPHVELPIYLAHCCYLGCEIYIEVGWGLWRFWTFLDTYKALLEPSCIQPCIFNSF